MAIGFVNVDRFLIWRIIYLWSRLDSCKTMNLVGQQTSFVSSFNFWYHPVFLPFSIRFTTVDFRSSCFCCIRCWHCRPRPPQPRRPNFRPVFGTMSHRVRQTRRPILAAFPLSPHPIHKQISTVPLPSLKFRSRHRSYRSAVSPISAIMPKSTASTMTKRCRKNFSPETSHLPKMYISMWSWKTTRRQSRIKTLSSRSKIYPAANHRLPIRLRPFLWTIATAEQRRKSPIVNSFYNLVRSPRPPKKAIRVKFRNRPKLSWRNPIQSVPPFFHPRFPSLPSRIPLFRHLRFHPNFNIEIIRPKVRRPTNWFRLESDYVRQKKTSPSLSRTLCLFPVLRMATNWPTHGNRCNRCNKVRTTNRLNLTIWVILPKWVITRLHTWAFHLWPNLQVDPCLPFRMQNMIQCPYIRTQCIALKLLRHHFHANCLTERLPVGKLYLLLPFHRILGQAWVLLLHLRHTLNPILSLRFPPLLLRLTTIIITSPTQHHPLSTHGCIPTWHSAVAAGWWCRRSIQDLPCRPGLAFPCFFAILCDLRRSSTIWPTVLVAMHPNSLDFAVPISHRLFLLPTLRLFFLLRTQCHLFIPCRPDLFTTPPLPRSIIGQKRIHIDHLSRNHRLCPDQKSLLSNMTKRNFNRPKSNDTQTDKLIVNLPTHTSSNFIVSSFFSSFIAFQTNKVFNCHFYIWLWNFKLGIWSTWLTW